MDVTAIANLAESLTYYIEIAQKEYGLDDEDITLAIRRVMIERGMRIGGRYE